MKLAIVDDNKLEQELIIQLDNAPDTSAEQPVKFGRIFFINGDVFQTEIGELGLVVVPLEIGRAHV